ncbi:MAG: helix-turn-helix transcriptional regulator [Victivallales bacterium]|nr:helix-turn-helix transcriptional regulator [Victivallales bacterium]
MTTLKTFSLNMRPIPRQTDFPYRLTGLFQSRRFRPKSGQLLRIPHLEFSLRIESQASICHDIINGKRISAPFPHACWKLPGQTYGAGDSQPRDTVSFLYPAEFTADFRRLGMLAGQTCFAFSLGSEIQRMFAKYWHLLDNIHLPGMADEMDWLAFQFIRHIQLANLQRENQHSLPAIVQSISIWLRRHCCEDFDLMEIIRAQGISHTLFYREWNQQFPVTPHQYVMEARLETAAALLRQSSCPIAEIVKVVHFSNTYSFHRRFTAKFGMSPGLYRKQSEI